jgi:hypothetical protein
MHPSTEDLLSVRDGEPLDARTSEAIADSATHANEVERLRRMQSALQALSDLDPPVGAWKAIAAAERETRLRSTVMMRRIAGTGIAAAVALAGILYLGSVERVPEVAATPPQAPNGTVGEAPTGPEDLVLRGRVVPASYSALVQESARLDRVLGQMPYQRPLMSGATASTIAGLEDRIAFIDEQLTYGSARGQPQPQRAALWGERVELMNALVHVRYAQAQPGGF